MKSCSSTFQHIPVNKLLYMNIHVHSPFLAGLYMIIMDGKGGQATNSKSSGVVKVANLICCFGNGNLQAKSKPDSILTYEQTVTVALEDALWYV